MTIEKLYDSLNCDEVKNNPFETKTLIKARNDFYNKYIKPMPFREADDAIYELDKVINIARKVAFAVGYRTAISLLMPGMLTPMEKQKAPGVGAPDAFQKG